MISKVLSNSARRAFTNGKIPRQVLRRTQLEVRDAHYPQRGANVPSCEPSAPSHPRQEGHYRCQPVRWDGTSARTRRRVRDAWLRRSPRRRAAVISGQSLPGIWPQQAACHSMSCWRCHPRSAGRGRNVRRECRCRWRAIVDSVLRVEPARRPHERLRVAGDSVVDAIVDGDDVAAFGHLPPRPPILSLRHSRVGNSPTGSGPQSLGVSLPRTTSCWSSGSLVLSVE